MSVHLGAVPLVQTRTINSFQRRRRSRTDGQVGGAQCDQIGRFISLWATFQSQWQQFYCPNCPHFLAIFVNVSKSFIFLVKSFWAPFIDIWQFFSGHTARNSDFGCWQHSESNRNRLPDAANSDSMTSRQKLFGITLQVEKVLPRRD